MRKAAPLLNIKQKKERRMKHLLVKSAAFAVAASFATEAVATDWNVSVWGKRRAFTEHLEKLAELVSEKTGGEFTLNISYGGLSKNRENLDGISIGAFEMAQFCAGYHPDKNRTLTALELPFLGVQTLEEQVAIDQAVYAHPATIAEMAEWSAKLVMPSPMPQYNLVGTGAPRDSLASMKGMRVRSTGGMGKAFEMLGAVPTSVTATEAYQAMQSGVVDTVAFAQHAHLAYGTIDNADWWTTNLNPGTGHCPVVVNVDAYESLSEEERAAFDSSIPEAMAHYLANYGEVLDNWDNVLTEKSVDRVEISEVELAKFRESAAMPIREAWIADMESQNIPGQQIIDLIMKTLDDKRAMN
jgi:TRAP-type C4-dicarboxylate transport system substrate-binding protein